MTDERSQRHTASDTPSPRTFADIRERERQWLCPGYLAAGVVTILVGPKGSGKTSIGCKVVADLTGGPRRLGGRRRKPQNVLYFSAEDDPARDLRPRLRVAGANLERVIFPPEKDDQDELWHPYLPADQPRLARLIADFNIKLVV